MTDNNSHTASSSSFPPSDWVETILGEIATFSQGFQVSTDYQYPEQKEGFVRFVRIVDYTNEGEKPRYIENPERCFVNEDDLVMIRYGSQTAGKIVRGIAGVIANNTFQIKPTENIDKNWLYWFLRQDSIYQFLNKDQSSSTMPAITFTQVGKLKISIPPLPEQQAIASVLSAFDDKIELLREQNKTLEEMGQVIFQEWFGKYGVDDELPDGWRVGKLGKIVDLLNGFAYKSSDFIENGKYRLVTIVNVQDGSFVENTKDGLDEIPQKMPDYCNLKTGDILLSLTGNVGRVCHVIGENYFLNQRVAKLQAKEKKDYGFIYTMFRQSSMIGLLESISAGTAQQNLSPIRTAELEIVIPSREILNDFANTINPMIDKMLDNKLQIQSLARSRDELLPKLMSGAVRINDFSNN